MMYISGRWIGVSASDLKERKTQLTSEFKAAIAAQFKVAGFV